MCHSNNYLQKYESNQVQMCHSNKCLQKYESNQIQMCHSNKYLQASDELFIILELIQPNSARIWENKACPRLLVECQWPGSFQNAYNLPKIGVLIRIFSYFEKYWSENLKSYRKFGSRKWEGNSLFEMCS